MADTEHTAEASIYFLAPPAQQTALPVRLTPFVGREQEVLALADQLNQNRLVTVTGPGGVGKSRLALESLERLDYPVVWVELGPITDPRQVPGAVASVLGLRQEPGRPLAETLRVQMKRQELVLALDNVEHLLPEVSALVDGLLRAAPKLRVLTTSRQPLHVEGELTWRLPPLTTEDAVDLFLSRAAQVQQRPSDLGAIRELCARLDNLPLAIELASARLRMMTVAQLLASVEDRFRLLTGTAHNVLPQQRTLESSMAWSYDLLDGPAQHLLRRLSVFAGDFSAEATADEDLLAELVDRSLVQVVDVEPRRFRLLEAVRDFARARMSEAGESEAARTRHAEFFRDLAERAAPYLIGPDAITWLSRLEAEQHELETALQWWHNMDVRQFRRTVVALGLFWELRRPATGVRWLRIAVHDEGDGSALWAQVLWQSAHMGVYGDDLAATQRRAPEAVAAAARAGDAVTIARAATTANYCVAQRHPPTARAALAQSVLLCREANDAWGTADALKMASIACLTMGDEAGVADVVTALRHDAEALGNAFFIAWCDALEGYVALQRGEADLARQRLTAAAHKCREIGDPLTGWLTTTWLADLDALIGERDRARRGYASTLARAGASGGTMSTIPALLGMAKLRREDGDTEAAASLLVPVAEAMRNADPLWRSMFATEYGRCLGGAQARPWLQISLEAAKEIQNPGLMAAAHHALGELAVQDEELALAEAAHHLALSLRVQVGHVPGILESLEALAVLRDSQPLLTAVRAARGLAHEGLAMSLEEAIAFATRKRGARRRPAHGWASLTPTELEVVRLVAEGLNNVQIGERMFIGRGTVKTHLSHVFAKLGVATRAAVAAEVTRRQATSLPPG